VIRAIPVDEEEMLEWERVVECLEGGGLAGPQWVSWRARISRHSRERRSSALVKVDEPEAAWVQPDMFQVPKRKEHSLRVRGSSTRGGVELESAEGGDGGSRAEHQLEWGGHRGVCPGGHGWGVMGGWSDAGTEGSTWQGSSPHCGEPSVAPVWHWDKQGGKSTEIVSLGLGLTAHWEMLCRRGFRKSGC
jgi:hypothetical protein